VSQDNGNWRAYARCRGKLELFYSDRPEDMEAACQICQTCRVQVQCLHAALERAECHGVWGGKTAFERLVILNLQTNTQHEQGDAHEHRRTSAN